MNQTAHFCSYTPYAFFKKAYEPVLYYQGQFDSDIISALGQELRHLTSSFGYVSWKLFAVFVELAQNIHFHSIERNYTHSKTEPIGFILVEEEAQSFQITTANLINQEKIIKLQNRCEAVNQLSPAELRKYKNELLSEALDHQLRGGNIGLVQVVLLSQEKIQFYIQPVNETTAIFTLTSIIKKI
jgi:hypothetical protein